MSESKRNGAEAAAESFSLGLRSTARCSRATDLRWHSKAYFKLIIHHTSRFLAKSKRRHTYGLSSHAETITQRRAARSTSLWAERCFLLSLVHTDATPYGLLTSSFHRLAKHSSCWGRCSQTR